MIFEPGPDQRVGIGSVRWGKGILGQGFLGVKGQAERKHAGNGMYDK